MTQSAPVSKSDDMWLWIGVGIGLCLLLLALLLVALVAAKRRRARSTPVAAVDRGEADFWSASTLHRPAKTSEYAAFVEPAQSAVFYGSPESRSVTYEVLPPSY